MDFETLELPEHVRTGLKQMVEALTALNIRFALIGGFAVGFRSQPRTTKDLDFILEIPQLTLPKLLEELRKRDFVFDPTQTIREWTQNHLTQLDFHGMRIDWLKPVIPLYSHVIDRSKIEFWLGCSLPIATPEGLILTKLIGFRSRDQVDIEKLLAANPGQIDLDFIQTEWASIARPDDPRMNKFLEMVGTFYGSTNK
jgi:hypothetical protein